MMKRQGLLAAEFALMGVIVGICVTLAWPAPQGGMTIAFGDNASAEPKAAAAAPMRTAYVDFVLLLKSDPTFLTMQLVTMRDLQVAMRDEADSFEAKRADDQKSLAKLKPDSMEYRDLMKEIIDSSAASNRKRLVLESEAQRSVDEAAQEAFKRLKNLTAEVAKENQYNQVMVISTTPLKGLKFEEMQKQLLLSPVLIYAEEDDITKVIEKKNLIRSHGYLEVGDPTAKEGTIENDGVWAEDGKGNKTQRIAKDKVNNPSDVWFEVKLGEKLQLGAAVTDMDEKTDKRGPALPANAEIDWSLVKLQSGTIDEKTGLYTAPAAMPATGDIVPIVISCKKAVYKFKTIRIRLK